MLQDGHLRVLGVAITWVAIACLHLMHDELGGYSLQNSRLIGSVAAGAHVDLGEVLVLANYLLSILLVF